MKAEKENESRKREFRTGERTPLYPDQIRKFKDQIRPGDIFWLPLDDGDGVEKYRVLEKYAHFVRLKTERRRRNATISVQYTQLMIAERETEYGSRA